MNKSFFIKLIEDVSFLRFPIVIDPDWYSKRKSVEIGVLHKCQCILEIRCPATCTDQVGISFPIELSRMALIKALNQIRWKMFFPKNEYLKLAYLPGKIEFQWFGQNPPLFNGDETANRTPKGKKAQKQLSWEKTDQKKHNYETFLEKTWYEDKTFCISEEEQREIAALYKGKTMRGLVFHGFDDKNASLESIAERLLEDFIRNIEEQVGNLDNRALNDALSQNAVAFSLELYDVDRGFSVGACIASDPFPPQTRRRANPRRRA